MFTTAREKEKKVTKYLTYLLYWDESSNVNAYKLSFETK